MAVLERAPIMTVSESVARVPLHKTSANQAIARGDIPTTGRILGHARPSITAKAYAHLVPAA